MKHPCVGWNVDSRLLLQAVRRGSCSAASAAFLALVIGLFGSNLWAQSYYSKAEKDGFVITKLVSDTVVNSGRNFTYSITFSIPAGATGVRVSDVLPATVEYLSSSFVINQTCAPGTPISILPVNQSIPVLYSRGSTYALKNISAPCGAVGSFSIVVRYPIGVTCDGAPARNQACMSYTINGKDDSLCSGFVSTIARAKNTWKIMKEVVNAAYQGGNCPNAVIDTTITYKVHIYKDNGIEGQMNLVNAVVTDLLPTGASLLSGSTTCAVASGSTLTWNIPNQTVANYNHIWCTFTVTYPRTQYPIGSQVLNTALLTAGAGDSAKPCLNFKDSSTVCSEIKEYQNGQIAKWVTTNSQPGCAGIYYVRICNRGNLPMTNVVVYDTLPSAISYTSLVTSGLPTGWTALAASTTSGATFVKITAGTQTLLPGSCVTVQIHFSISASAVAGSTITNCAYLTADSVRKGVCCSFVVKPAKPVVCLWKEVCSQKSCYNTGDTITYRLRIQNIGGMDLSNSIITDVIDRNLVFVSNVRAYKDTLYNTACSGTTDSWGAGLTTNYSAATRTVTFGLPTIPFNCNAYGTCGQNSNSVPFYFVEFKVRVSDSSAIGSINNVFSVSGGTLSPTVSTSNIHGITVCANSSYWIEKQVKPSSADTAAYTTTAVVTNTGTVDYRLRLHIPINTPPLASLRFVSFIDELPMDVNPTTDQRLSVCSPSRGSTFGLTYFGTFSSSLNPVAVPVRCNPAGAIYPRINTWLPTGAPANLIAGGCSSMNPANWLINTSLLAGSKNNGFYFDQWAFAPLSPAPTVEFRAKADSSARKDSLACNSFVATAAVRHIINGGTYFDAPVAEAESQTVCIVKTAVNSDTCLKFEDGRHDNWTGCYVADISVVNDIISGSPTKVLRLTDASGPSYAWDNVDFDGNWLTRAVNGCLCFDYKVDWNSNVSTLPRKAPGFAVYTGTPINSTTCDAGSKLRAGFVGDPSLPDIVDNQWAHFCLPIAPCTGSTLPSNVYGKWIIIDPTGTILTSADTCAAWFNIITSATGVYLGTDYNSEPSEKVYFDNFCWDCTDSPCNGDEVGAVTMDSSCCTGYVPITNLATGSSPITQIIYTVISGGQVKDIKAIGACATGSYTNPISVYGSTSGQLNFNPFCASSSFNLSLDILATLPTTCIRITVVHANGARCTDSVCFHCKPAGQMRCDSVFVLPYRYDFIQQEWKNFEVYNLMYPASPICKVKFSITPTPSFPWTGGGATVDNVLLNAPAWGQFNSGVPAYSELDLSSGGLWGPALNSVFFNIGLDYTLNSVYQWNLIVVHCDGRECRDSGQFCAMTDPSACPSTSTTTTNVSTNNMRGLVAGSTLVSCVDLDTLNPMRQAKFATFTIADSREATMLAVTAADLSLTKTANRVGRSYMTDAFASVVFEQPLKLKQSVPVRFLMQRKDSSSTKPIKVNVVLYDSKANPLNSKSIEATGSVTSVDKQGMDNGESSTPIILRPEPNPASSDVLLRYWMPQTQSVELELYSMVGEKISTLSNTIATAGYNTVKTNLAAIASGTYIVKLTSPSGVVSTTFTIVH